MKVTPVGKKFNKHAIGDVFTLPDKLAHALIRIGKVESAEGVEISPRTGRAKRTYRRRDMQAEA